MGKIDVNTLNKGMEMVSNMTKFAANISEKDKRPNYSKEENMNNQPHSQTVEVKVGDTDRKPVVPEKKEIHIHKPFPDNRALTTQECEVEKLRLQMEFEDKKAERTSREIFEEKLRAERKEREEYERRERERRYQDNRKSTRKVLIGVGILGAIGLGICAYGIYTDSRRYSGSGLALPAPQNVTPAIPVNPISTEGTVK